jgi:hypothetical protein
MPPSRTSEISERTREGADIGDSGRSYNLYKLWTNSTLYILHEHLQSIVRRMQELTNLIQVLVGESLIESDIVKIYSFCAKIKTYFNYDKVKK